MSDLEIEKAAMGPRRWIKLCVAFEKQHLNDPDAKLCPRSTRIINDAFATDSEVNYDDIQIFFVPSGRYLVSDLPADISVLDLGYTSSSDCMLVASVEVDGKYGGYNHFQVQASPDGMGLTIFSCNK